MRFRFCEFYIFKSFESFENIEFVYYSRFAFIIKLILENIMC